MFLAEERVTLTRKERGHLPITFWSMRTDKLTGVCGGFRRATFGTLRTVLVGHFHALVPCDLRANLTLIPWSLSLIPSLVSAKITIVAVLRAVGLVQDDESGFGSIEFWDGFGCVYNFYAPVRPPIFAYGAVDGLGRIAGDGPAMELEAFLEILDGLADVNFTVDQIRESVNEHVSFYHTNDEKWDRVADKVDRQYDTPPDTSHDARSRRL